MSVTSTNIETNSFSNAELACVGLVFFSYAITLPIARKSCSAFARRMFIDLFQVSDPRDHRDRFSLSWAEFAIEIKEKGLWLIAASQFLLNWCRSLFLVPQKTGRKIERLEIRMCQWTFDGGAQTTKLIRVFIYFPRSITILISSS